MQGEGATHVIFRTPHSELRTPLVPRLSEEFISRALTSLHPVRSVVMEPLSRSAPTLAHPIRHPPCDRAEQIERGSSRPETIGPPRRWRGPPPASASVRSRGGRR